MTPEDRAQTPVDLVTTILTKAIEKFAAKDTANLSIATKLKAGIPTNKLGGEAITPPNPGIELHDHQRNPHRVNAFALRRTARWPRNKRLVELTGIEPATS